MSAELIVRSFVPSAYKRQPVLITVITKDIPPMR